MGCAGLRTLLADQPGNRVNRKQDLLRLGTIGRCSNYVH